MTKHGLELPQPDIGELRNKPGEEVKPINSGSALENDLPEPEFGSSKTPSPLVKQDNNQSQGDQGQQLPFGLNPAQTTIQNQTTANADMTLPTIAEDNDLIEKEWVDKAKKIVEQTKNNPYEQNREVNKVKADYMKKRYNKDIKLNEE